MGITLRHVSKSFGAFAAVQDVSFEVPPGSLTAVLGPSGCGKSTLLRVVAGLEQPDAGDVLIDSRLATAVPPQQRGVGFVFQHYAAFKHMTVRDNVGFGLKIRKWPKTKLRERVAELLELVQLTPHADRYPSQLSGGQRQRMVLARALAVEPSVLLLDEPFGALDARVRQELRDWLRGLHERLSVTTLLVTHDQEEAMELASQVVVMNRGRVEQIDSPVALYARPATEFVMEFVGKVNRLGNAFIRPHDVVIRPRPEGASEEGKIRHLSHLGHEVRIDLGLRDGQRIWAHVPPLDAEALALSPGQTVWVDLSRKRVLGGATNGPAGPLRTFPDGHETRVVGAGSGSVDQARREISDAIPA
jgi:sulfate/thiosulfate transport system ATP-binding protein